MYVLMLQAQKSPKLFGFVVLQKIHCVISLVVLLTPVFQFLSMFYPIWNLQ